jgi:hypothetical protein
VFAKADAITRFVVTNARQERSHHEKAGMPRRHEAKAPEVFTAYMAANSLLLKVLTALMRFLGS